MIHQRTEACLTCGPSGTTCEVGSDPVIEEVRSAGAPEVGEQSVEQDPLHGMHRSCSSCDGPRAGSRARQTHDSGDEVSVAPAAPPPPPPPSFRKIAPDATWDHRPIEDTVGDVVLPGDHGIGTSKLGRYGSPGTSTNLTRQPAPPPPPPAEVKRKPPTSFTALNVPPGAEMIANTNYAQGSPTTPPADKLAERMGRKVAPMGASTNLAPNATLAPKASPQGQTGPLAFVPAGDVLAPSTVQSCMDSFLAQRPMAQATILQGAWALNRHLFVQTVIGDLLRGQGGAAAHFADWLNRSFSMGDREVTDFCTSVRRNAVQQIGSDAAASVQRPAGMPFGTATIVSPKGGKPGQVFERSPAEVFVKDAFEPSIASRLAVADGTVTWGGVKPPEMIGPTVFKGNNPQGSANPPPAWPVQTVLDNAAMLADPAYRALGPDCYNRVRYEYNGNLEAARRCPQCGARVVAYLDQTFRDCLA